MNKSNYFKIFYCLLVVAPMLLQGCGLLGKRGKGDDRGELVGVAGREGWKQEIPYGMVLVPSGTFHMGQADEDVPHTMINMNKQIPIGGFYMDDTEITKTSTVSLSTT
jgi:formylglycine-generating enzyme required for sulfatase activity